MSNFVLGVDGGQTSTKCVLTTTDGHVLGLGQGSGLTHFAAEGGREQFVRSLTEAIQSVWGNANLPPQPLAAIGLGLTGVEAQVEIDIAYELLPQVVIAQVAEVQSDAVTALVGAHLDQPGIMMISGTGMIALGQDRQGHRRRAGGWGWLLGDEGSAQAIGRDGLIAALHAFDGVLPPTTLTDAFLTHFNAQHPLDIKRIVYAPGFGAAGFAGLAAVVSRVAEQGDTTARSVIEQAGRWLAREVAALIQCLDFGDTSIPVAPVGGAFEYVCGLKPAFTEALLGLHPQAYVRDPLLPPMFGAVLLALRKASLPVVEFT